ncbi:MAG: hypothetical protein LBB26_03400 [Puniceicoccales bacterium]|jgi:hypothetical protein|nr:hypothetical protein [Puniceicoccales bacterium]
MFGSNLDSVKAGFVVGTFTTVPVPTIASGGASFPVCGKEIQCNWPINLYAFWFGRVFSYVVQFATLGLGTLTLWAVEYFMATRSARGVTFFRGLVALNYLLRFSGVRTVEQAEVVNGRVEEIQANIPKIRVKNLCRRASLPHPEPDESAPKDPVAGWEEALTTVEEAKCRLRAEAALEDLTAGISKYIATGSNGDRIEDIRDLVGNYRFVDAFCRLPDEMSGQIPWHYLLVPLFQSKSMPDVLKILSRIPPNVVMEFLLNQVNVAERLPIWRQISSEYREKMAKTVSAQKIAALYERAYRPDKQLAIEIVGTCNDLEFALDVADRGLAIDFFAGISQVCNDLLIEMAKRAASPNAFDESDPDPNASIEEFKKLASNPQNFRGKPNIPKFSGLDPVLLAEIVTKSGTSRAVICAATKYRSEWTIRLICQVFSNFMKGHASSEALAELLLAVRRTDNMQSILQEVFSGSFDAVLSACRAPNCDDCIRVVRDALFPDAQKIADFLCRLLESKDDRIVRVVAEALCTLPYHRAGAGVAIAREVVTLLRNSISAETWNSITNAVISFDDTRLRCGFICAFDYIDNGQLIREFLSRSDVINKSLLILFRTRYTCANEILLEFFTQNIDALIGFIERSRSALSEGVEEKTLFEAIIEADLWPSVAARMGWEEASMREIIDSKVLPYGDYEMPFRILANPKIRAQIGDDPVETYLRYSLRTGFYSVFSTQLQRIGEALTRKEFDTFRREVEKRRPDWGPALQRYRQEISSVGGGNTCGQREGRR